MALQLKESSKLKLDPALSLSRDQLQSGFIVIYNMSPRWNPGLFTRLWASAFAPELMARPGAFRGRNASKFVTELSKINVTGLLNVKKEDDHFTVRLPIASFPSVDHMNRLLATLAQKSKRSKADEMDEAEIEEDAEDPEDEGEVEVQEIPPEPTPGQAIQVVEQFAPYKANATTVLASFKGEMHPRARVGLTQSLIGVEVQQLGERVRVFFTFKITKAEAEYMTNTQWLAIREMDLYAPLQAWSLNYFGSLKRRPPPKNAFSVARIARTLPTDPAKITYKINEKGLSIDRNGRLMYLPRDLNDTQRYEDLFLQAGMAPGRSGFQLRDDDPNQPVPKLPVNIPVLMDWVNCKFSYTNTSGMLTVQDVSRFQKASPVHINTILKKNAEPEVLRQLENLITTVEGQPFKPRDDENYVVDNDGNLVKLDDIRWKNLLMSENLAVYLSKLDTVYKSVTGERIKYEQLAFNSEIPAARAIGRFLTAGIPLVLSKIESVYTRYSVSNVTHNLGYGILLAEYAPKLQEVEAQSNALTEAASNQGVDPDWVAPALPLINNEVGRLPHQSKIANIMRGSPQFAILPVQAGGGKSLLTITDILQEFKNNQSAPYLILCPGHLIATYVKEIAYFTKGRLNVIPISTYVIRKNGYDRITHMIQHAPRNTVVVCGFDVLRLKGQQICYGTTAINVYPIAELLKQFSFGYCLMDESHYLKNDSARSRAVAALVVDIPKKRLASGTMAHDSPSDLAIQIATLDPTLFGTRDEFNERFAAEDGVKGGRVIEWKPGAQQEIMRIIKSRVVVAGAMRKEWAALLPPVEEQFIPVTLTPAQQRVYNILLAETMEEIQADKALMERMKAASAEEETEEAKKDEDSGEDLASMLKPYLSRIEQFITAPARDKLGNLELQGDDRISPKVHAIAERIRDHITSGQTGKVMIFTNYIASAEEIYAGLPQDLQRRTILYTAGEKIEAAAQFETDNNIIAMVGVENSINTGLNLQFISRLIRVETVWNPGTLEQGNSRLNRPKIARKGKGGEARQKIIYDWIIADRTIDITKISRLISKIVSVAKFDNADDVKYEDLPDLPIIKMDLDSLRDLNDWKDNLVEYAEAYAQYRNILEDDYADYRAKFIAKYGDDYLHPIEEAPAPPDAKLMARTPYVPGLELYGQDELGLVRLDIYLKSDDLNEELANEGEEENVDIGTDDGKEAITRLLIGRRVHTEFGEGFIERIAFAGRRVIVRLTDTTKVPLPMSAVFVETRTSTNGKDLRRQILKMTGELPVDTEPLVPAVGLKNAKLTKREMRRREAEEQERRAAEQERIASFSVDFNLVTTNGFPGVIFYTEGQDPDLVQALIGLGFRPQPEYHFARMPNALRMKRQIDLWAEKGFHIDEMEDVEQRALYDLYQALLKGFIKTGRNPYTFATRNELRNFYRVNFKPSPDKRALKAFPMVENGVAYICLPTRGQPSSRDAMRYRAPGVNWQPAPPAVAFFDVRPNAVGYVINKVKKAGIQINNIKELYKEFKLMVKMPVHKGKD